MTDLRLEPHTKEGEDRFLLVGFAVAILIFLGANPVARWLDAYVFTDWMDTHVAIIPPTEQFGTPLIEYEAGANRYLTGTWKAYTAWPTGHRICGGQGIGNYARTKGSPEIWAWDYWLGKDCDVPRYPFRVCVRYGVTTAHGASKVIGPTCSDVYDPAAWPPGSRPG